MAWLTFAQIPIPALANFPKLGDFLLAYAVYSDLENAELNFLSATPPGPQYANPQAYLAATIQSAINNAKYNPVFSVPNPIASGITAAMSCFSYLSQLPVSAGDQNSVNIMTAWENGTGQLYGGHPAIPANTVSDPGAPAGSGPVTILGQPVG